MIRPLQRYNDRAARCTDAQTDRQTGKKTTNVVNLLFGGGGAWGLGPYTYNLQDIVLQKFYFKSLLWEAIRNHPYIIYMYNIIYRASIYYIYTNGLLIREATPT